MKNKKIELWKLCEKFIEEQRISCPETIYQSDHVIQNAYEFIEKVAATVGYYKYED
jgi:hypothetical protein